MNEEKICQISEITERDTAGPAVIRIVGRVAEPVALTLPELRRMDNIDIADMPTICGSGEPRGRMGRLRGVLLSDIVGCAEVVAPEHNDTKKMIIVATAADGYKTVFSWQEIFNSPNGDGVIVALERDGRPFYEDYGGADLFSTRDHLSGPRHVRRLTTIEIVMLG